ncbi:MAG TPA: carboxylesterase family protein [Alphaproteobacteria bacterium]|nr:carboxylesterase family protein [Alphaproteobacteria bacterium]
MRLAAFLPVVLCLGLVACGQSQNSGGQSSDASSSGSSGGGGTMAKMEPVVSVDGGQIRGQIKDGVASYLAIPYAASPTGNLRWMPPQPVAAWDGVRDATQYGASCMQGQFGPAPTGTDDNKGPKTSEDCLFVNVWTPEDAKGKNLPVMLWVHGGAYILGSGSLPMYEGTGFAKSGVVLVTINYRLGNLGFFAHPAIDGQDPNGEHGNYAFMDQKAALKWVQNNIAKFGGDPNNVTLFGQSAGGASVGYLLTMPSAKGLYQKVIMESGSIRSAVRPLKDSSGGEKSAEEMGQEMAKALGLDNPSAEDLREIPAAKLMAPPAGRFMPGPIEDGKDVMGPTYTELAEGNFNHVPVLLGANSYEVSIMRGADKAVPGVLGAHLDQALKLYDGYGTGDKDMKLKQIAGDIFMVDGARNYAESLAKAGVPTYLYHFDYVASFQRATMPGTGHIFEIPFVFDTVNQWSDKATDEDRAYAKKVHPYWVAFAKDSNPNGDDRPMWPQFNTDSKTVMYFGPKGPEAKQDFEGKRLDFLDKIGVTSLTPKR